MARKTTTTRKTRPSTRGQRSELPVKKASDIDRPRSWVFYGRAGTGKTTLAGSFPAPILLLDCKDEGTDSVSDISDLYVRDIHSLEDLEDTYWWLVNNPGQYKTVVIDTVTQLQQLLVEEAGGRKAQQKGKQASDWGVMTKQDWGDVASKMKTWITNFRDLPVETVFLAQDRVFNADEEDAIDGEIDPEIGPRLSPSVMSHLCAAVSVIGNTFVRTSTVKKKVGGKEKEIEKTEYCIRLGPSASYITKIRKPKNIELPAFLKDPTFEEILETIKGDA